MELMVLLGASLIGIIIIWKIGKGILRTVGLVAVLAVVAYFVLMNGGLG